MELFVQIVSFGSAWWVRPGSNEHDAERYTKHAAYFNSTGVCRGSKIHTAGPVHGVIRFNVSSGLNPHCTQENVGRIFRCHTLERYRETNRLLVFGPAATITTPTHFLIRLDSNVHGRLVPRNPQPISVQVVSVSCYRGSQEALLLVEMGALVETTLGMWSVLQSGQRPPQLHLIDDQIAKSVGAAYEV